MLIYPQNQAVAVPSGEVVEELAFSPTRIVTVAKDASGDYRSIGAALADVAEGARIKVRSGIYKESLVITKAVEIIGDGPTDKIILIASDRPCISLIGPFARIANLTLRSQSGNRDQKVYAVNVASGQMVLRQCDVKSNTLSAIAVHGAKTSAVISGCTIHDSGQSGIFIYQQGRARISDCDIYGNTLAGISIQNNATVTIGNSKLHDGRHAGIQIFGDNSVDISGCQVFANDFAGVSLKAAQGVVIADSDIRGGYHYGLLFADGSSGRIANCRIAANSLAGIAIKAASDPSIANCRIIDGKQYGVFVDEFGKGTIEACEISGNALAGIAVKGESSPTIRNCQIRDGKQGGLFIYENSTPLIEGCDISNNTLAGIEIVEQSQPIIRDCRIFEGKQGGLFVYNHGRGTLIGGTIYQNLGSGITITEEGALQCRGVEIYSNQRFGIFVENKSTVEVVDSQIHQNILSNLLVRNESTLDLDLTTVRDSGQAGLYLTNRSVAEVRNAVVSGNSYQGIAIDQDAVLRIQKAEISQNQREGIRIAASGSGTLDACQVFENALSGVRVASATIHIRASHITRNGIHGLEVIDGGRATLENSDLAANQERPWVTAEGGEVRDLDAAAQQGPGQLFVTAIPQTAAIEIVDPQHDFQQGVDLDPGQYRLRVSAEGYQEANQTITIRAAEATKVNLALEPVAEPVPQDKGRLTVRTDPEDARIRILNIVPKFYQGIELAPGRYRLAVSAAGHSSHYQWIELARGEDKIVEVALPPTGGRPATGRGRLFVKTTPAGAGIKILNISPRFRQGIGLDPGRYRLEVSAPGHVSAFPGVDIVAGEKHELAVTLDPLDRKAENYLGRLIVNPEPSNASVRLLDIVPVYLPGISLPAGRHRVEVAAPGHETTVHWAVVEAGRDNLVEIALTPYSTNVRQTLGRLFVDSTPVTATIKVLNIDPKFYQGIELQPDRYQVEISAAGHVTAFRWIEVIKGADARLEVSLVRADPQSEQHLGRLFVQTDPEQTRIKILNIKPKFRQGIELAAGRYRLEVSAPGYQTLYHWAVVEAAKDNTVTLSLTQGGA